MGFDTSLLISSIGVCALCTYFYNVSDSDSMSSTIQNNYYNSSMKKLWFIRHYPAADSELHEAVTVFYS